MIFSESKGTVLDISRVHVYTITLLLKSQYYFVVFCGYGNKKPPLWLWRGREGTISCG